MCYLWTLAAGDGAEALTKAKEFLFGEDPKDLKFWGDYNETSENKPVALWWMAYTHNVRTKVQKILYKM